jgi:hypothetical protein
MNFKRDFLAGDQSSVLFGSISGGAPGNRAFPYRRNKWPLHHRIE